MELAACGSAWAGGFWFCRKPCRKLDDKARSSLAGSSTAAAAARGSGASGRTACACILETLTSSNDESRRTGQFGGKYFRGLPYFNSLEVNPAVWDAFAVFPEDPLPPPHSSLALRIDRGIPSRNTECSSKSGVRYD
jgi:hypothetical protein